LPNGARETGHFRKRSLKRAYPLPVNPQYLPGKSPVIIRFPLTIRVQDEREDLYYRVKKLILRLEIMIYADKIGWPLKIKAIKALAELVARATGILNAYEVEELERTVKELEAQAKTAGGSAETTG